MPDDVNSMMPEEVVSALSLLVWTSRAQQR